MSERASVALTWIVIAGVVVAGLNFCFWRERPYVLIRFTAARAIAATAEFQHKTKLAFEIDQVVSFTPGLCHYFGFLPQKMPVVRKYLNAGTMKFYRFGNSGPNPYESFGSAELVGEDKLLLDRVDSCDPHGGLTQATGAYELELGESIVQITGIQKSGNQALVDFRWHFHSINEIGLVLPGVQRTREHQLDDPHLTANEKSIAPFWTGTAEFTKYDDGWRVAKINLESRGVWGTWEYGPLWPDPEFNWGAFDESQNHD